GGGGGGGGGGSNAPRWGHAPGWGAPPRTRGGGGAPPRGLGSRGGWGGRPLSVQAGRSGSPSHPGTVGCPTAGPGGKVSLIRTGAPAGPAADAGARPPLGVPTTAWKSPAGCASTTSSWGGCCRSFGSG